MTTPEKDESWAIALACAKKIGYVPSAFSQAIRLLVSDHLNNKGQIRAVTKYQVARVFRGPSFKAVLYFATQQLAPDFLAQNKGVTVGDLVALYGPLDLAAFITCFFLTRRLKKVAPEQVWTLMGPKLYRDSSIGALVGVAIPRLGFAPGLLIGALRNMSFALLALNDLDKYRSYRKKLDAEKKLFDETAEKELWRTTSSQVSTMILTHVGFKSDVGKIIAEAMSTKTRTAEIPDKEIQSYRLAFLWSECFISGLQQPAERLDGQFFPFEKDRLNAEAQLAVVRKGATSWLDRSKKDLTPESAPHLFVARAEDPNFEVPEELKDVFNLKELTSMDELDFDALVDQIDAEQAGGKKREDVIASKDLDELENELA